eukprot:CAMPEP_0180646172 /NCGR_PEP_ID=MMETSP1037_2-20121125/49447_1 /TAXON_ID=632150 /ORGANISM="Azadinium spinosum, Strain 3D9" /LENGTH=36 /DNA_ID= /DNA_START= /DNA_END= /DNA_ORIENTATION=
MKHVVRMAAASSMLGRDEEKWAKRTRAKSEPSSSYS